ncbi:MAG: KH domain-containing protein [Firmicutes bacterium]|nr:KH domain-containing protein [Bacillota bacterium]
MKELLEYMARALVLHPDSVQVDMEENPDEVRLRLAVDPADTGKVIGKQGRIAQAMRTVMKAAAVHDGRRVSVDIQD